MKSYMMVTIAENFPCELKDHRQHGPIKQRHTLTKVSETLMTKCRSKVKGPWSSSITSANAMPIPVINSIPSSLDSSFDLSRRKSLRGNHI